jgi:hypothetical protein
MRRIGGLVIVFHVTTLAGIGRANVIAVMANNAIDCNSGMGSGNHVIVVMDGKCDRFPAGDRGVTVVTGNWK